MRRFFKWVVVLAILAGTGWVAWKWYNVPTISADAFSFIPKDAIYCIATDDPISSWKEIAGSEMWTHLQRNSYFAQLTASANSLDSLLRENDLLFELIGSRALIVSAHMVTAKDYDFLFLADLEEVSGIKFLNEYLTAYDAGGFSVRKEIYNGEDLITLHDPEKGTDLYVTIPGHFALLSYSRKIITSALDTKPRPGAIPKETIGDLIEVGEPADARSLFQVYLNYAMLPAFTGSFSSGPNEYVNRLSQALRTSTLGIRSDGSLTTAHGYTYVNDSVESYLRTLVGSGKGPHEFLEIAPSRTAFCLGLGFDSFAQFFANFESNLQQDVTEYKGYKESLGQVEKYLGISIQDDLVNWVGDEISILELQSRGAGLDTEIAVALKADNIEEARTHLEHIEKMVRRKTPVKFKSVEYKDHTISYLGVKGLFRILLGKFFARYDKPYYTIINNFVIFSNHPQTLEGIIDDYLEKETLIRSDEFRSFKDEFEDESAVFIYLNTAILFNSLKNLADQSTRMSMERNRDFITCFSQVGFQMVPEQNRFKTIFAEEFVAPITTVMADEGGQVGEEPDSVARPNGEPLSDSVFVEKATEDPMTLPYIYVQDINSRKQTGYFADSTVHFEVEVRNGFKEGSFTEYHAGGEVKMTGRFRSDKRDGRWSLFDPEGKLILRRQYDLGQVTRERARD